MDYPKRQFFLVASSVALSFGMFPVVAIVSSVLDPLFGYVATLAIYWICFCIPTALAFGRGTTRVSLGFTLSPGWAPLLAIVPPLFVFVAADHGEVFAVPPTLLTTVVVCAFLNGTLEELSWRRCFRANSNNNLGFEALGLVLFTFWHVPLYSLGGITYDYGAVGLIGGSFVMGALWMVLTRATNSVGWNIVSHILVNLIAFSGLFRENFFV